MVTMPDIEMWLFYLRVRKFAKVLALKTLLLLRRVFPRFLAAFILCHVTGIKLRLEEGRREGDIVVCRYMYGAKGCLCFSVDFDVPTSKVVQVNWRQALAQNLRLFEMFNFPVSWGICGKLALNEPETFQQIIESNLLHDIGVHTFTHIDLSEEHCTVDVARDEVLRCINFLEKVRRPVTFIFPWNRVKYLDVLRELGFATYRGNGQTQLTYPYKQEELWNIPQTYYLTEKSVNEVNFIRKLIDLAIAYNVVVHIWTHLWNMALEGDAVEFADRVMEPLLGYAKQRRDEGSIWICTMRELANYCEARENCRINHIEKTEDKISFSVYCKVNNSSFDFPPILTLKIQIPKGWKSVKVSTDVSNPKRTSKCYITKRSGECHLYFTITFDKASYTVHITKHPSINPKLA